MLPKKIYIKNLWHLVLMWWVWLAGGGVVFLIIIFNLNELLDYRLIYIDPSRRQITHPYEYAIQAVIVIAYLINIAIWRKSTFRKKDFIAVAESIGVKFVKKHPSTLVEVLEDYSFMQGFLNSINVVAKIDWPFLAYQPFPRLELKQEKGRYFEESGGGWTPGYMKQESRVELFSLISEPFNIDATINIDDGKRDIPTTGSPETDGILINALRDVNYFHARLMFNKDYLRMAIIGGSWEGKRFGENIVKGMELFKKLDSKLRSKYPVMDWEKWQVKWNRKEEVFYLQPKDDQ